MQNGVHIKSRGNVALPTDIVKVLKTQDENYVRTMRSSGLKVCLFIILPLLVLNDHLENREDKEPVDGDARSSTGSV